MGIGVFVAAGEGVMVGVGGGVGAPPPVSKLYAARALIRPAPNTLSGPAAPKSVALAVSAVSSCAAVKFGLALSNRAIAPVTWGAENEVPLAVVNRPNRSVVLTATPGATTAG